MIIIINPNSNLPPPLDGQKQTAVSLLGYIASLALTANSYIHPLWGGGDYAVSGWPNSPITFEVALHNIETCLGRIVRAYGRANLSFTVSKRGGGTNAQGTACSLKTSRGGHPLIFS